MRSFTQIRLKIKLFLEKKAHFCQILQGVASNYWMLNSSGLFPAVIFKGFFPFINFTFVTRKQKIKV